MSGGARRPLPYVATVVLTLMAWAPCATSHAGPARVWFSVSADDPYQFSRHEPSSPAPQAVHLDLLPEEQASVYVWLQPQTFDVGQPWSPSNPYRRLHALSLNGQTDSLSATTQGVVFDNPAGRFTNVIDSAAGNQASVFNPLLSLDGPVEYPLLPHLTGANGAFAALYQGGVLGLSAYDVFQSPNGGVGGDCTPGECVVGPAGPVWRLARMDIAAGSQLGPTGFQLQIGGSGFLHEGEVTVVDGEVVVSPLTQVVFGGDSVSYDASSQRAVVGELFEHLPGDNPDLVVTVTSTLSGDYNGDGAVGLADYTVWRDTFGSTTDLAADGDGDGVVDDNDYAVWVGSFGRSQPTSSATAVPEPNAGLVIGAIAAAATLAGRQR